MLKGETAFLQEGTSVCWSVLPSVSRSAKTNSRTHHYSTKLALLSSIILRREEATLYFSQCVATVAKLVGRSVAKSTRLVSRSNFDQLRLKANYALIHRTV